MTLMNVLLTAATLQTIAITWHLAPIMLEVGHVLVIQVNKNNFNIKKYI